MTIREAADEDGIAYSSCQPILKFSLRMHPLSAKFVSYLLAEEKKTPIRRGASGEDSDNFYL